jgi:uncharacterized protein (DUF433 family)
MGPRTHHRCETDDVVDVLDREMYSEAEAARLLRVPQSTLHYWLDGGVYRGKRYRPIVRIDPRSDRTVTWAEFVEAGLLREYRKTHRVPMAELRAFIDVLRDRMGVPYPLAHERPFVADRQLVLEAQDESGLTPEYCLVAWASGQLILTPPSQSFVERIDWADDIAAAWRPHNEPGSTVRIDPNVRFGRPAVGGISTEAIWEQEDSGEDVPDIAETFGLSVSDVRWALAYENSIRAA